MSRNLVQLIDKLKLASPTRLRIISRGLTPMNTNLHVRTESCGLWHLQSTACGSCSAENRLLHWTRLGLLDIHKVRDHFHNGANHTGNFESWILIKKKLLVCRSTTYAQNCTNKEIHAKKISKIIKFKSMLGHVVCVWFDLSVDNSE